MTRAIRWLGLASLSSAISPQTTNGDRLYKFDRLASGGCRVVSRGELYWVDLGPAEGSAPALRRPVLVVQANPFNESRIATVIVVALTSNTQVAEHPGNVFVPAAASGLRKDSAVNVSQLITLNKDALTERIADLPPYLIGDVDSGLRQVLAL